MTLAVEDVSQAIIDAFPTLASNAKDFCVNDVKTRYGKS